MLNFFCFKYCLALQIISANVPGQKKKGLISHKNLSILPKKKKKDISNLVTYFAILFSRLDSLTEMYQP